MSLQSMFSVIWCRIGGLAIDSPSNGLSSCRYRPGARLRA
jgi:hypothetical protein